MQEVEAPFDEVVRPVVNKEEEEGEIKAKTNADHSSIALQEHEDDHDDACCLFFNRKHLCKSLTSGLVGYNSACTECN